jgi:hypothetical protein
MTLPPPNAADHGQSFGNLLRRKVVFGEADWEASPTCMGQNAGLDVGEGESNHDEIA